MFIRRSAARPIALAGTGAVLVGACVIISHLWAETPHSTTRDARIKLYHWFEALGYPDVKDLKFVRVETGEVSFLEKKPQRTFVHGFLVGETKDSFKVFLTTTEICEFDKRPGNDPAEFAAADLVQFTDGKLKSLGTPKYLAMQSMFMPSRAHPVPPISEPTEALVLSWACWRKGHDRIAVELFDAAAKAIDKTPDDLSGLEAWYGANLLTSAFLQAVNDFGNAGVPREQLLARFEQLLKIFPDGTGAAQALEFVAMLKTMVKEDKEHAARVSHQKPSNELAKTDQIAELVYDLRDYNRASPDAETAVARLQRIGYDVMPQLIAALDDKRLTRTVTFTVDDHTPTVQTIGDAAAEVLDQVAGRNFGPGNLAIPRAERIAEAKKDAEAWYAEFKRKGEKQMLIEATEKGDNDSSTSAERLAEKFPDAAVAALAKGIDSATDDITRQDLIAHMEKIPGDGPMPFLLHELKKGKTLDDRVIAAAILVHRKRDEAVAAMIGEWRNADGGEDPDTLATFLAGCGKVEAIKALADGLDRRPISLRFAAVSELGDTAEYPGGNQFIAAANNSRAVKRMSRPWTDAAIRILFLALDDTEDNFYSWTSTSGLSCANARVCDVAGYDLHRIDPKRFPFDLSGTWAMRDRDRAVLKNVWRKENGLPPLSVPELRKTVELPVNKLKPLLDRLEQAPVPPSEHAPAGTPPSESALVAAEIEKLGAGALAATLERSKSLGTNLPLHEVFDRLAGRLASTVVAAQYGEKSLKPEDAIKARFEEFKGKPLDPPKVASAIEEIALKIKPPVYGIKFFIRRGAGEAGTTLRLDLIDKRRASDLGIRLSLGNKQLDDQPYFYMTTYASIGLMDGGGFGIQSGPLDTTAIEDTIERAASAKPSDKVDVGLQITPE